jgi:hypothetical protein
VRRLPRRGVVVRLALLLFVLAWLFGPAALRSAVPIWLPFLVALGLEVQFFLGAAGAPRRGRPRDRRGPQDGDRLRFGYGVAEPDDLLLVREGGAELWIPYAGETGEDLDALVATARERAAEEATAPARVTGARPRPLRRLLLALAVIGAAAAAAWFVDSRSGWRGLGDGTRHTAEALFSREASRIAGHPATIHCDDAGAHVGFVQHADGIAVVGGDTAYLTPERCYDLYRLAFRDEVHSGATGRAIAVLAHEAWHLHGVADESTTECYALQTGVQLGRRLGLAEPAARRLMRQQFAENGATGRVHPEYLVTGECRDGGPLDLHPAGTSFP